MKRTKLLVGILFLLLLSSFAFADINHEITITTSTATNDFSVFSVYESLSLCSCASGNDKIIVTNTGSFAETYQIGSSLSYTTLSQSMFALDPGQQQEVYVYINAPCGSKSSDTMTITVYPLHGESKSLDKDLFFTNCQNLRVDFSPEPLVADMCLPFSTTFDVVNTGTFADTYTVTVNELAQYATLTKEEVTVAPLQKESITAFYDLPCDMYGEKELSYTVTSEKTLRKADFSQLVSVAQDFDFTLATVDEFALCDTEQKEFLLTLTNNNHFADEFKIGFSAPGFVDLMLPEQEGVKGINVVALEAGETLSFSVVLSPTKSDAGVHNLSFAAKSLTGDITKELTMPVEVYNCFDFNAHLNLPFSKLEVCGGDTSTYGFMLAHEGYANPQVNLVVDGPEYLTLEPAQVAFDGREIVPINLVFDPVANQNNRSKVTITSYFGNQTVGQDSFTLISSTDEKCYGLKPKATTLPVRYDADNLYVKVKHVGFNEGYYDIVVKEAPAYLSLNSSAFELARGQTVTLTFAIDREQLIADANEYSNGSIDDLTGNLKLEFSRVDSPASFEHDFVVEFTQLPWYEWAYKESTAWLVGLSLCAKIFLALIVLLALTLLLIIIKFIIGFTWKSSKWWGLALLIFVVIVAVVLLLTYGAPTKDKFYTTYDLETNSTIYLRLTEDSAVKYDLSQFFFDPDGNIVSYGVIAQNDSPLTFKFRNDMMKIIPAKDYDGLTDIKLTATDAYGASATSEDIFVHVLPVEDYTCKEFFSLACHYWVFVLLVIVAVLLYVECSMKRKKTKRELAREEAIRKEEQKAMRLARKAERDAQKAKEAKAAQKAEKKPATKKAAKKSTKSAKPAKK